MTDRIIEEVDEKYERDYNQPKEQQLSSIYAQLSTVDRSVNKIVSKMKHRENSYDSIPQKNRNVIQSKYTSNRSSLQKDSKPSITRYNYYGKKYRFQQKQQELNVPPPEDYRDFKSQVGMSMNKTKQKINKKQKSEIDQQRNRDEEFSNHAEKGTNNNKIFFDNGRLQFPSQNYYIYFDNPPGGNIKRGKRTAKQQQKSQYSTTGNEHSNKFKPAWVLEKKITGLQKQIKTLKQHDKKFQNTLSSLNNSKTMRQSSDFPINLQSNLEKMIDTLWL